jgi:acylphosphatase
MAEDTSARTARRYHMRGSVQGVGYRYGVRAAALVCEVAGWIRMLPDFVIEVHAEGTERQLANFRDAIQKVPGYATGLQLVDERVVASEHCTGFEIRQSKS